MYTRDIIILVLKLHYLPPLPGESVVQLCPPLPGESVVQLCVEIIIYIISYAYRNVAGGGKLTLQNGGAKVYMMY